MSHLYKELLNVYKKYDKRKTTKKELSNRTNAWLINSFGEVIYLFKGNTQLRIKEDGSVFKLKLTFAINGYKLEQTLAKQLLDKCHLELNKKMLKDSL